MPKSKESDKAVELRFHTTLKKKERLHIYKANMHKSKEPDKTVELRFHTTLNRLKIETKNIYIII